MSESEVPQPPAGAGDAGKALWTSVLDRYEMEVHELALLREAVRTADYLAELDEAVRREGLILPGSARRVHPGAVEARQQRIALARLLAALRLPAGEDGDEQAGARPQRRVGARGVYSITGGAAS